MTVGMVDETPEKTVVTTATLEHLTGAARGTASLLSGDALDANSDESHIFRIVPPTIQKSGSDIAARFHRSRDSYEIEACGENSIWGNGEKVSEKLLVSGDIIEFGDAGPLCHFNLSRDGMRLRKTVAEISNSIPSEHMRPANVRNYS